MQKTTSRNNKDIQPTWYIIDAQDQILGRLATKVATVLRGKHKVDYTPHVSAGDVVVVTNAAGVRMTGNKWEQKLFRTHSGHLGHLKEWTARKKHEKDPTFIVFHAISGMLAHNRNRRVQQSRLKVYPGTTHPFESQKMVELK